MKKFYRKKYLEGIKAKQAEQVFVAQFKQLTPKQQEEVIKKLVYEMELIDADIKDLGAAMPHYLKHKLSDGKKLAITTASMLVSAISAGVIAGEITNNPGLGVLYGCLASVIGICSGELAIFEIEEQKITDFFKDIKDRRIAKKIAKLEGKRLKLLRKLNSVTFVRSELSAVPSKPQLASAQPERSL